MGADVGASSVGRCLVGERVWYRGERVWYRDERVWYLDGHGMAKYDLSYLEGAGGNELAWRDGCAGGQQQSLVNGGRWFV